MEKEAKPKPKGLGKWAGLIILCLAQIGTTGDNTILSVATASLIKTLNATMPDIQLANLLYSVCSGCLMIVGAMIGIMIGWRKNFTIGTILCALGELMVATSTSIVVFTWAGRLLVGVGASLLVPSVLGLVSGLYKGKDRAVAFGAIGAAMGFASCIAPIAAGALIDFFSWRVAFGFMACYFLVVAIGSLLIGKVKKPESKVKFDPLGTVIAIVGLFAFEIGITKISTWGLITPIDSPFTIFGISPALPLIILGIIILYFFVVVERKVEAKKGSCLIPSVFLTTPQVRNGLYLTAYEFICFTVSSFLVVTYMQLVGGMSAITVGLILIVVAIPMIAMSIGVPKYLPHISPRLICQLGIISSTVGAIIMAFGLDLDGINPIMYIGLAILGAGEGLITGQVSNIIATSVNGRDAQQSGGIQSAIRNIGHGIGIAVLGVVMIFSMTGDMQDRVKENTVVSQTAKNFILEQKSIAFSDNKSFEKLISNHVETKEDVNALLEINALTRQDSMRKSFYVFAGIGVLVLLGTRNLPTRNKD